eukprot:Amastigsp_a844558_36.p4 type:complete len:170 gc:universal Amastigsp_a844558_36:113-622(+)
MRPRSLCAAWAVPAVRLVVDHDHSDARRCCLFRDLRRHCIRRLKRSPAPLRVRHHYAPERPLGDRVVDGQASAAAWVRRLCAGADIARRCVRAPRVRRSAWLSFSRQVLGHGRHPCRRRCVPLGGICGANGHRAVLAPPRAQTRCSRCDDRGPRRRDRAFARRALCCAR